VSFSFAADIPSKITSLSIVTKTYDSILGNPLWLPWQQNWLYWYGSGDGVNELLLSVTMLIVYISQEDTVPIFYAQKWTNFITCNYVLWWLWPLTCKSHDQNYANLQESQKLQYLVIRIIGRTGNWVPMSGCALPSGSDFVLFMSVWAWLSW